MRYGKCSTATATIFAAVCSMLLVLHWVVELKVVGVVHCHGAHSWPHAKAGGAGAWMPAAEGHLSYQLNLGKGGLLKGADVLLPWDTKQSVTLGLPMVITSLSTVLLEINLW